jgi:hypothetical protein
MTEAEWNDADDPQVLLGWLRQQERLTNRKARLFAVACCRRIWHLLTEEPGRRAVEVAERYADGRASQRDMEAAAHPLQWVPRATNRSGAPLWATWGPWDGWSNLHEAVLNVAGYAARARGSGRGQRPGQAALLRDIFGPLPFRAVTIDPSLLMGNDGAVARLAQAIYEGRAFARMPELADALGRRGAANPRSSPTVSREGHTCADVGSSTRSWGSGKSGPPLLDPPARRAYPRPTSVGFPPGGRHP